MTFEDGVWFLIICAGALLLAFMALICLAGSGRAGDFPAPPETEPADERATMPPDPTCASHGCDERPRHTSRGRSLLCDRCQEMQNDVIEQRRKEWDE